MEMHNTPIEDYTIQEVRRFLIGNEFYAFVQRWAIAFNITESRALEQIIALSCLEYEGKDKLDEKNYWLHEEADFILENWQAFYPETYLKVVCPEGVGY